MRSTIYSSEITINKNRKFGEATIYYPANFVRSDEDEPHALLFTASEIDAALRRAEKNVEDISAVKAAHLADRKLQWETTVAITVAFAVAATMGAWLWFV